jgi:hypothetical protein
MTYCRDMLHKSESLPAYATENLLALQYQAASGVKALAICQKDWVSTVFGAG